MIRPRSSVRFGAADDHQLYGDRRTPCRVEYQRASAPLTISTSSLVIAACLARLYWSVSELISSSVLRVAASIAAMRAACSPDWFSSSARKTSTSTALGTSTASSVAGSGSISNGSSSPAPSAAPAGSGSPAGNGSSVTARGVWVIAETNSLYTSTTSSTSPVA